MEFVLPNEVQDFTTIQKGRPGTFFEYVFMKVCSRSDFWTKNISTVFFKNLSETTFQQFQRCVPEVPYFVDFWKTSRFISQTEAFRQFFARRGRF